MNHRAFTLIELLVVVAIIGILAAVGVVAYNGYTGAAKKNVTKSNYSAMYKKILLQIQECEINGSVQLMRKPNDSTYYNRDCSTKNGVLYVIDIVYHMNNSGNPKNPYGDTQGAMGTDDAYLRSHFNNATQNFMVGFVTLYPKGPNMVILHACFKLPCEPPSNTTNRLYNEIALP